MSLSKHKSHNYAAVFWLSSESTKPCQMHAPVQIPLEAISSFFPNFFSLQTDARNVCLHVFEMYRLFFNKINNTEVSFTHYSRVYIAAVDSISTINQCSKYHKIRQSTLTNFFYLGCGCLLVKKTKSNFCLHS